MIGVRPQVTATLSADHRATDGATGARYLSAVDRFLQHPEELRNATKHGNWWATPSKRSSEILSARTGIRIDDEDTPRLTTLDGCTQFLLERAESVPR